ncbi:MAG: putative Ig protein [Chloroflexi bacterium]|nr:putative Ig protein [Chloroflexota bacterium]
MKKAILYGLATFFVIVAVVFTGCAAPSVSSPAGNGSPTSSSQTQSIQGQAGKSGNIASANPSTGKLEIKVTDAPAKPEITGILVTVTSIEIHKAGPEDVVQTEEAEGTTEGTEEDQEESKDNGGWQTIEVDKDNNSFDLFAVKDNPKTLVSAFAEAGNYTQIRLVVDKVLVDYTDEDGEHNAVEAKVPSGKIKFVHALDVNPEAATELLFDFDAAQSVVITGNGNVIFKPVIRLSVSKDQVEDQDVDDEEETEEETEENAPEETPDNQELSITTHRLADGIVGTEYSADLEAQGGTQPYEWSVTAGQLPAGLTIIQDKISGEPTAEGTSTFTVQALDADGAAATREFTLKIKK